MLFSQKLELSGNRIRSNRLTSNKNLRRPESEYARHRKQNDQNPRYKYENIVSNELDLPDKTTQEYEGPEMISRLDGILSMNLNGDDGEEVSFANNSDNGTPNPFLYYNAETGGASTSNAGIAEEKRERKSKSRSSGGSSSRPKSASRKR